jgi:hypothetical protein
MQTFQDTVTLKVWQFEDDVVVTETNGVYTFTTAHGVVLNTPTTLQPYTIPAPTAAQLLAQAQQAQIATLTAAYQTAIVQPVSYTSKGGITKTYQADPNSLSNLQNTLLGLQAAGATPSGFYWVSADNTQVSFAYADLQGLAAAMLAQGWAVFQKLQTLKAQVNAATTVSAVQAVVWS